MGDLAIDVGVARLPDAQSDPQTHVYFAIASKPANLAFSDADAAISNSTGIPIAKALHFDGAQSIIVGDDPRIDIRRQITLEAWILVDEFDTNLQAIVQKGDGESSLSHTYAMYVREDGSLVADTSSGTVGQRLVTETGLISTGRWYHVAAVIDRNEGQMRLFVNGRTANMQSGGNIDISDSLSTPDPLRIGGDQDGLASPFNGLMEEVRIWETARTPGQIADNMNRRLSGNESGLVAYYRMEESIGGIGN